MDWHWFPADEQLLICLCFSFRDLYLSGYNCNITSKSIVGIVSKETGAASVGD